MTNAARDRDWRAILADEQLLMNVIVMELEDVRERFRERFANRMRSIDVDVPRSQTAESVEEALEVAYGSLPEMMATTVVGHVDPGGGFAAGIWTHNDVAYLGTWGRPGQCPASGVRIIDTADPADPTLVKEADESVRETMMWNFP